MPSRSISDLNPSAARKCQQFLALANERLRERGLQIFLTCTYRSQVEQDQLYAQGRTKPGPIVTWTRRSMHSERRAWDVAFKGLKAPVDLYRGHDAEWELLGQWAKELAIKWGGDYKKNRDRAHFYI